MRDDIDPAPARLTVVPLRPVDLERFRPSRRPAGFDEFCPC